MCVWKQKLAVDGVCLLSCVKSDDWQTKALYRLLNYTSMQASVCLLSCVKSDDWQTKALHRQLN